MPAPKSRRFVLFFRDRADGATRFASTAIDADLFVYDVLSVSFLDGFHRAGSAASAAHHTFVTDKSGHSFVLLFIKYSFTLVYDYITRAGAFQQVKRKNLLLEKNVCCDAEHPERSDPQLVPFGTNFTAIGFTRRQPYFTA